MNKIIIGVTAAIGIYIVCATLAAAGLWFFIASLIDYYKG